MVSMIVTMDDEGGISRDGHIPWSFQNIRSSRNLFERIVPKKSIVLMKRGNFLSRIPGRTNVLVDDNALERLQDSWEKEGRIWVTGGLWAQLLRYCTFLYITHIEGNHSCDTFFPPEYKETFKPIYSSSYEHLKRSVWVQPASATPSS